MLKVGAWFHPPSMRVSALPPGMDLDYSEATLSQPTIDNVEKYLLRGDNARKIRQSRHVSRQEGYLLMSKFVPQRYLLSLAGFDFSFRHYSMRLRWRLLSCPLVLPPEGAMFVL